MIYWIDLARRLSRHHLWRKPEWFSFLDRALIIEMSLFKERLVVRNFGT